jgi:hypothetical protein
MILKLGKVIQIVSVLIKSPYFGFGDSVIFEFHQQDQLASKAKDSLKKKKKGLVVLLRRKGNQAFSEGASRGNLCVVVCLPLYIFYYYRMLEC